MKNSWVQWVAKELAIVLPDLFDSDLQYNLQLEETEQLITMPVKLAMW